MSIRMFVAPFVFALLLCSQILIFPSQVLARCCYCGQCWMQQVYGSQYCYCGGNCPICWADGFDASRLNTLPYNSAASTSVPRDLTPFIADTNLPSRIMDVIGGGDCFRTRVLLSLLGNNRAGLTLVLSQFDENNLNADNGKELVQD